MFQRSWFFLLVIVGLPLLLLWGREQGNSTESSARSSDAPALADSHVQEPEQSEENHEAVVAQAEAVPQPVLGSSPEPPARSGSYSEWSESMASDLPVRVLAQTLEYLDKVARDRKLALKIAGDLGSMLESNPELFEVASLALSRPHSANSQQCLLSALRQGVVGGHVPYLSGDYLAFADDPPDDELWIYVIQNSGGLGDRDVTRVILEDALNGPDDFSVALGFASIQSAVRAEHVAGKASAARRGETFDSKAFVAWKRGLVESAIRRAEAGGAPAQALGALLSWVENDPELKDSAEAIQELIKGGARQ